VNGVSRFLVNALQDRGLLLASDATLPSVATIVAGAPVPGSWWAHPKAHAIFAALSALSCHPDAIAVPLVSGKVTFVHRRLWPALVAVACARERWQTAGLSPQARALLKRIETSGELQASGDAARELARRLLVRSEDVHTDKGSHAKRVEQWDRWAQRVEVKPLKDVVDARRAIEEAAAALTSPRGARSALPWGRATTSSRARRRRRYSAAARRNTADRSNCLTSSSASRRRRSGSSKRTCTGFMLILYDDARRRR
jgi:hypothetical protein